LSQGSCANERFSERERPRGVAIVASMTGRESGR
jgi:hypothetical protein